MHVYKVGEPYSPNKKHWAESVDYNYRGGEHELRLFYRTPSPVEVEAIRKGQSNFALSVQGDAIFFCYQFGNEEWGDCGFSIHLVPEAERQLPPEQTSPEARALLNVILIDAENGLIRVLRAVSLSPKFTAKLHQAIRAQAARPFPPDYEDKISEIYRRYTSRDLAMDMAVARCKGGE